MANSPKILVFSGSERGDSSNKKLAKEAAEVAKEHGAFVTFIDLADFSVPLYNGDDEAANGIPENMQKFKALLKTHDAFIISSPEYNGHVSPLLLNVLSWASRPEGDEAPLSVFTQKPVAIMAASPGGWGGLRVIPRLRDLLSDLSCMPIPGFMTLPNSYEAFDDEGHLKDEQTKASLEGLVGQLVQYVQ